MRRDGRSSFFFWPFTMVPAPNVTAAPGGGCWGGAARDGGLSAAAPLTLE